MKKKLKRKPEKLDVIVDSSGGDIDAAYHMAKMLSEVATKKLTFIVPRWAKSAATLLVCGGDEILMGNTSELGPLDPQIKEPDGTWVAGLSLEATLNLLKEQMKKGNKEVATLLTNKLSPLHLGEHLRALQISGKYLEELLLKRMFKNKKGKKKIIKNLKEKLAKGYTHHSYIIDYEEASKLKLKVKKPKKEEWELIWKIYTISSQMAELRSILRKLNEYELLKKIVQE